MREIRTWRGPWAAICGLLLVACGCDESPTAGPVANMGQVVGTVMGADLVDPRTLTVRAATPAGILPRFEATTHPDIDGRFVLAVPRRPVLVSYSVEHAAPVYHTADGLTVASELADTLVVDGDVRRVTAQFGRLILEVEVPTHLQGAPGRVLLLADPDDRQYVIHEHESLAGRFTALDLPFVAPGAYHVQFECADSRAFFLPGTYEAADAEVVAIEPGETTRLDLALPDPGTIAGSVTGSWQAFGVATPTVSAWRDNWRVASTTAAADGSFALLLAVPGPYCLNVEIGGSSQWIGGADRDDATVFDVAGGETIAGIDHVESGLRCSFAADGVIPGRVDASLVNFYGWSFSWLTAMVDGDLVWSNLRPGYLKLRLRPTDPLEVWLDQYWNRSDTFAGGAPIEIPAGGQVAQVTATLVRGAQIRGRLLSAAGQPVVPISLTMYVSARGDSSQSTSYPGYGFQRGLYDAQTGDVVLPRLRDGDYVVGAQVGAHPVTWWPGRASRDSAGVLAIVDLADVECGEWRLLYPPAAGR